MSILGGGYYGKVRLGTDPNLGTGKHFAIKLIKPLVIEQALSSRLESIQKTFQNEIKVSCGISLQSQVVHALLISVDCHIDLDSITAEAS